MLEITECFHCIGEIRESHLKEVLLCSISDSYSTLITASEGKEQLVECIKIKLIDEYEKRQVSKHVSVT